jgi:hypothetical protein
MVATPLADREPLNVSVATANVTWLKAGQRAHIIKNASIVGSTRGPKRYAGPGVSASSMTDPRLAGSWANLPKNRPSTEPRRGRSLGPAPPIEDAGIGAKALLQERAQDGDHPVHVYGVCGGRCTDGPPRLIG